MKRASSVIVGVIALVAIGGIGALVLSRPKAPQRNYIAEYDELVTRRHPEGRAGLAAFEALVALDRSTRIEAIAKEAVERAIARAEDEGLAVDEIRMELLVSFVTHPGEPGANWLGWPQDPAQFVTTKRVLAEARAEALPGMLEVLMDPAARAATAEFVAHETVLMPFTPGPSLFGHQFPDFSAVRGSARADATLLRIGVDEAARLDALRSMLAMARVASSNPVLIGGLVQIAIEDLAATEAMDAAAGAGQPPADARAWLAEFERHASLRPANGWHFVGERLGILDAIDAEYTNRAGVSRMNVPTTMPLIGVPHARMHAILEDYFDELDRAVAMPPSVRTTALPSPDEVIARVDFRARPMLKALMPAFDRAIGGMDRTDAHLAGAITALAIAAYRADHAEAFPASLDDLVPGYLAALPNDPFAPSPNTPLVYRVQPDGTALLYSIGRDLIDDGGTPMDPFDSSSTGDLVVWPR